MATKALSDAQMTLMLRLATVDREESPFGYGRNSGRMASAWHRTVTSLVTRGLVVRSRFGDHYAAQLSPEGRQLVAQRSAV